MKWLLVLALIFTSLALPADAEHRQVPYEDIIAWSGCKAALVTSDDRYVIESFYNLMTSTLYIGTKDTADLPQEVAEMVLFHEIGHCLQHQAGLFNEPIPRVVVELDADRWAADLACGLHRDGKRLLHDIFVWAYETLGYEGDPGHGTLAQRIAQGDNAAMCKLTPRQAPLVRQ